MTRTEGNEIEYVELFRRLFQTTDEENDVIFFKDHHQWEET